MAHDKTKVVRIITRLNIGGPAIHATLLSRDMQSGYDTVLVSGIEDKAEGNMLEFAMSRGVVPVRVSSLQREVDFGKDIKAMWSLYRMIRKEKPLIVHTHTAKAGAVGRLAAKLAGVPIIVHTFHGHTFYEYFSPLRSRAFILIEKILSLITDSIIVVSGRGRDDILKYGIAGKDKVVHIPLGLELESLLDCEKHRGEIRQEFGFSRQDLLVGIVARLVPIKGHNYFLEAAEIVAKSVPQAKFLIVGDGELRADLEKAARDAGISDKVFFLGFRKDLEHIYADLDLAVLSSLNEGLPVAIIEAMCAAKPVVATDVGGVAELVTEGQTGKVFPSRSPFELAQGIIELLSDPPRMQEMGEKARVAAYPKYSIKRLVCDMEGLYSGLLKKKCKLKNE